MSIHINSRTIQDFILEDDKIIIEECKSYSILFRYLEKYVNKNYFSIKKRINKRDYQVLDLNKNIILCKNKKNETKTILQIGYPFPIIEKILKNDLFDDGEIRICLHKKSLRDYQKNELKLKLGYKDIYLKKRLFKSYSSSLLKSENLYYLDLFNFIGDSIINFKILEIFQEESKINSCAFSRNFKCLKCFSPNVLDLKIENLKNIKEDSVILIPNFIDIHQITFNQIINALINKNLFIFVIGRNYIINTKTKEFYNIINQNEYMLLKENVNDLIFDSINIFINYNKHSNYLSASYKYLENKKICICPLASTKDKSFSSQDILKFINKNEYFKNVYISLFKNEVKSDFKEANFDLLIDLGFDDLKKLTSENEIDTFICMDSASSAFFTKLNKRVFTIYKNSNWDEDNLRSISGESPLGFCDLKNNQIPIIYYKNLSISDISLFLETRNFCLNNLTYDQKIKMKIIFLKLKFLYKKIKNKKTALDFFNYFKSAYSLLQRDFNINSEILNQFFPIDLFKKSLIVNFNNNKKKLIRSLLEVSPLYKLLLEINLSIKN